MSSSLLPPGPQTPIALACPGAVPAAAPGGTASLGSYYPTTTAANALPAPRLGPAPAMHAARRWLLWCWGPVRQDGKRAKVPWYVNGGRRGFGIELDSPEDVAQLATYDEAFAKLNLIPSPYAGLGFALGHGWQGIDLDGVEARGLRDIADSVPGYVEYSPSGKGCHAIGYGRPFRTLAQDGSGIEAYSSGRFFTWTGNVIRDGGPVCLANYVEQVLRTRHGGQGEASHKAVERLPDEPQTLTDDQVMRSFWYASNAAKYLPLWHGEDVHGNASVNDWHLMQQLAFYTRNDEQLIRLFLRSGLAPLLYRKGTEENLRCYIELTIKDVRKRQALKLAGIAAAQAAMGPAIDAALTAKRS